MYTYMAYPCDDAISLEKKIESFLSISLGAYRVPEREQKEIIAFIKGLDIRKISEQVMQVLFEAVAVSRSCFPTKILMYFNITRNTRK